MKAFLRLLGVDVPLTPGCSWLGPAGVSLSLTPSDTADRSSMCTCVYLSALLSRLSFLLFFFLDEEESPLLALLELLLTRFFDFFLCLRSLLLLLLAFLRSLLRRRDGSEVDLLRPDVTSSSRSSSTSPEPL